MTQVTLLRKALRPHLQWHGARLAFLGTFLIALFQVKTVNLSEIATAFAGTAQPDSITSGSTAFSESLSKITPLWLAQSWG